MKKIFGVAVLVLLFNLTGCYTVLWSPGMDNTIPSDTFAYDDSSYYYGNSEYPDSNYTDSSYNGNPNTAITISSDYFYDPYYYGSYTKYYHHPWWLSYAAPKANKDSHRKEVERTGSSAGTVRNSGDGRGDYGRNSGGPTVPIINNAPPTVNTPGSTSSGNNGSGSTSSGTSNTRATSSTDNKSDNNDNSSSKNSSSGAVRNNDGNRNDGGRK